MIILPYCHVRLMRDYPHAICRVIVGGYPNKCARVTVVKKIPRELVSADSLMVVDDNNNMVIIVGGYPHNDARIYTPSVMKEYPQLKAGASQYW